MYELKPDFEQAKARLMAWWEGEILDRPPIMVTAPSGRNVSVPAKTHASLKDRWYDTEYVLDQQEAAMANTAYLGEALPVYWPNLGPDVFAGMLGCPILFGESTSWSEPIVDTWDDLDRVALDEGSEYLQKLDELTDAALERARGRYIVGYTDMHPGADCAAALRDPQRLCMDLYNAPEMVDRLLDLTREPFFQVFGHFAAKLRRAGSYVTTWLPLICEGTFHIPSNDFSYMLSPKMVERFFIDTTIEECDRTDRSVFHLDGRGSIPHLDLLLEIPTLDGIQPTVGAGDHFDGEWLRVVQRTQAAGKRVLMIGGMDVIDAVMDACPPEGILFHTSVGSIEEAEALIHRVAAWKAP